MSKIVFVFEGQHHCEALKMLLKENNRDYEVCGEFTGENTDEQAVECAKKHIAKGAVVIVSAGKYCELIIKEVSVPVVTIRRSKFSFALSYNEAAQYSNKIAILAREGVFADAAMQFRQAFSKKILVSVFNTDEDLNRCLEYLKTQGIEVLITGSRGKNPALKYGFRCVSVPLDTEDLWSGVNEAEHVLSYLQSQMETIETLKITQDNVSEGIVTVDKVGTITQVNRSILSIFGKQAKAAVGLHISQSFFSPITNLKEFASREKLSNEIININKYPVSVTLNPVLSDNNPVSLLIMINPVEKIMKDEVEIRTKLASKNHIATYTFDSIIGTGSSIKKTVEIAQKYACVDSAVLIYGDSGVGKEVFAHSIHNASERNSAPFVVINCAALPKNLLDSMMFGYEKGVFSGAQKDGKIGIFEAAHGGTIFLDEISELPLSIQSKFLRVLQEKEVTPLGSDRVIPVDIRVLSSSNKDLEQLAAEGKFRYDLYFRLAVLQLNIPPVAKRKEDIILLVNYFLEKKSKEFNKYTPVLQEDASNYLAALEYPGNVREIANIAERILVLSESTTVTLEQVMVATQNKSTLQNTKFTLNSKQLKERYEKELLQRLFEQHNGSKEAVAEEMGISNTTLWRRMKKYGL